MWATRLLAALALALIAMSTLAEPAHSDTLIVASDPRPKAELADRPGWVTLAFKRDVDVSVAKILVLSSNGDNVTVGPLIVEGTNVTTQLVSELPKDTYTVMYRIDRPDGQPEGGAFQFAYGTGHWTTIPQASWSGQSAQPTVMANPNPKGTTAAPPPTEVPSESASPTASESASAPGTNEPSAGPSEPAQGSSSLPWWFALILVALGCGAGVWWFVNRRGR